MTESKKLSRNGRPVGRPTTRLVKLKVAPTRCPASLHQYLKRIYPFLGFSSMIELYADILNGFIEKRPWNLGLEWRKPKAVVTKAGGRDNSTGWCQVNIQLEEALFERVNNLTLETGVARAVFIYTAMYWYAQYEKPPHNLKLSG